LPHQALFGFLPRRDVLLLLPLLLLLLLASHVADVVQLSVSGHHSGGVEQTQAGAGPARQ
jgi:hypothetical protein